MIWGPILKALRLVVDCFNVQLWHLAQLAESGLGIVLTVKGFASQSAHWVKFKETWACTQDSQIHQLPVTITATAVVIGVNRHSNMHAPRHIPGAQCAFKDLMIHWILQFALRIAFRCVLHRWGNQDIRCCKLLLSFVFVASGWMRHLVLLVSLRV